MSSVGRTTEGDDECRWIELRIELPSKSWTAIHKVLIPEKYLKKGETQVDHVVRAWRKVNDRDVTKIPLQTAWGYYTIQQMLPGPLEDVEKLENKVVESKLGKLECEGLTGSTLFSTRGSSGKTEIQMTYHIRLHKKAPFGVVSLRVDREGTISGQPYSRTVTFKLSDFGEDAESELPDHN